MKEFYEKIAADESLKEKLTSILTGAEAKGEAAMMAELLAFAKELGFEITEQEVKAFFEGMQKGMELSDDELDAVAGGVEKEIFVKFSVIYPGYACGELPSNEDYPKVRHETDIWTLK